MKLIFNGNRKGTFSNKYLQNFEGLDSFIEGIQMKNCIFYESLLPEEQNCFYPDELVISKGKL